MLTAAYILVYSFAIISFLLIQVWMFDGVRKNAGLEGPKWLHSAWNFRPFRFLFAIPLVGLILGFLLVLCLKFIEMVPDVLSSMWKSLTEDSERGSYEQVDGG